MKERQTIKLLNQKDKNDLQNTTQTYAISAYQH
jgi:hypothetical protein